MIRVIRADYLNDYVIGFEFSDGKQTKVDFYPFLSMPYQNNCVSKYLDKSLFECYQIIDERDIAWNNYEMCFRFEEIYSGIIEPKLLLTDIDYVCEPFQDYRVIQSPKKKST
jgi:hypothetical protein